MIQLKNNTQISAMRDAGRITGEALLYAGEHVKPGVTTKHLDDLVHDYIVKQGAHPSFLGYGGFPGSACISVNDEVIHGIPSKNRELHDGDVVKIDVGAYYRGYHGDSANTFIAGEGSPEAKRLVQVTKDSFYEGQVYTKGYFDVRTMGFGEVETDYEGTVARLLAYIERDFEMSDEYRARADSFFAYRDRKNSERVYRAVAAGTMPHPVPDGSDEGEKNKNA